MSHLYGLHSSERYDGQRAYGTMESDQELDRQTDRQRQTDRDRQRQKESETEKKSIKTQQKRKETLSRIWNSIKRKERKS